MLLKWCHIPASTAVFRCSVLDQVGPFDETLLGSGDWDMWLKIAERSLIRCVPEPLALYRVHPTNTTKMLFASRRVLQEHRTVRARYLQEPGRRSVSAKVANSAWARHAVTEAECEALAGNAPGVGRTLHRGLSLDPTVIADRDALAHLIAGWCRQCAPPPHSVTVLDQCLHHVLGPSLSDHCITADLARQIREELHLAYLYELVERGDYRGGRRSAALILRLRPTWMLNWGSLSILSEAFLGHRISDALRRALGFLAR